VRFVYEHVQTKLGKIDRFSHFELSLEIATMMETTNIIALVVCILILLGTMIGFYKCLKKECIVGEKVVSVGSEGSVSNYTNCSFQYNQCTERAITMHRVQRPPALKPPALEIDLVQETAV
jgi:hypothetical protein